MSQRMTQFVEHEYYHVYNRGVDKRDIFIDHSDYVRFQELLYLANASEAVSVRDARKVYKSVYEHQRQGQLVNIEAYCLMPNHFHILLSPCAENGAHQFMKKLSTGYSMYFNKRYDRTGSLFQGRYKSQHADSDEYLKYLYSYIHLNPVKLKYPDWRDGGVCDPKEAFMYAVQYEYSSLSDYVGSVRETLAIVNPQLFSAYFSADQDHKEEIFEWLTFDVD